MVTHELLVTCIFQYFYFQCKYKIDKAKVDVRRIFFTALLMKTDLSYSILIIVFNFLLLLTLKFLNNFNSI